MLLECDGTPDAAGAGYVAGLPSIKRVLAGHAGSAPERDSLCAVDAGGRTAAVVWARVPPDVRHQYRGLLYGAIHPDYRRRGVGGALVRWAEARAHALLTALPDDREKVLRIEFPGERPDAAPVYEGAGFRLHHVELELACDLRAPLPDRALPAELSLISWTPERADDFYGVCRDAFSTRPGPGMWTRDEWVEGFTAGNSFRADLTCLAVTAGDPTGAGYIVCDVRDAARRNPTGPPRPQTRIPARIMRGGAWLSPAYTSRGTQRLWYPPDSRDTNDHGLRLVVD